MNSAPAGYQRYTGAAVSFLLHAACIYGIIAAGSSLSGYNPPMAIDFSIERTTGPAEYGKALPASMDYPLTPRNERKVPAIEPPPKKNISGSRPMPDLHVPEPPSTAEATIAPPDPLPAAAVIPVAHQITPRALKKVIAPHPPPGTASPEQTAVPETEHVASGAAAKKEMIAEQKPLSPPPEGESSASTGALAAAPEISLSTEQSGKKYVKENFVYIQNSVQDSIDYPPIARRMGWQGKVLVSFVICVDGSVKDIRIVESSGFKALDNNAVKAIREIAPFPKPPVSAELTIPILYKLG